MIEFLNRKIPRKKNLDDSLNGRSVLMLILTRMLTSLLMTKLIAASLAASQLTSKLKTQWAKQFLRHHSDESKLEWADEPEITCPGHSPHLFTNNNARIKIKYLQTHLFNMKMFTFFLHVKFHTGILRTSPLIFSLRDYITKVIDICLDDNCNLRFHPKF